MKDGKLGLVLIGYGYWGQNLARNIAALGSAELKYIVDLEIARKIKASAQYPSTKLTADVTEALSDPSVDAVIIATPVHTHFELGLQALKAGKHILLEKPATATVHQALELSRVAKEKGLVALVDHTYLFTPAVQYMKAAIEADKIGKLRYIDSVRINLGLVQPDVNVLWDLAVHDISIVLHLMNQKPVAVRASGGVFTGNGVENVGYLSLIYANDFIAHFNCSWSSPVKIRHMLIGGDKKMILFNDLEPTEKVRIYDSGYEVRGDEEKRKVMVDYRTGDIYIPQLSKKEALSAVCEEFVHCIQTPRPSVLELSRGLEVVAILEAAQTSIKNKGKEVEIPWPTTV